MIRFALTLAVMITASLPARAAVDIAEVTSPGGITAWLVEEPSIPIVSVEIGFRGGSRLDPADKTGLTNFTMGLMNELKDHGYPLYVLSNMPVERFAYLQATYDFWDMFEGIVTSGHINMVKPNPDIYQHLLSTYDLKPETCVFLDDAQRNVKGAHAVGMQSFHFTTAATCRQDLAALFEVSV